MTKNDSLETTIRLPPHRLDIDETKFLSLLRHCVCLMKTEKRKIIEAFPRLSQYQVDHLIRIMEDEARDIAADTRNRAKWERALAICEQCWRELEKEMGN